MLPPSNSEYSQNNNGEDDDLEAQLRAGRTDGTDTPVEDPDLPTADVDSEADLEGEEEDGDELGQDEEPEQKPKKKGIGKGTIIAAVGAGLLVTLCGAAYMMQGQLQAPAAPAKQVAIDPSLLAEKPDAAPSVVTPPPQGPSQELTPNLNSAPPVVTTPSSISAPPSDPFASGPAAPVASATPAPATPAPVEPVAPVAVTPAITAPVVAITPAPTTEAPRAADPFGAVTTEKSPVAKTEKPVVTESIDVKPAKEVKEVKAKQAPVVLDSEVAVAKPRPVAKPRVKKPAVVRQDMSVSEQHPSQERMQPQSSESFHGYEKLF